MQRELTYQLPFERLRKLSRAASRKAYPKLWWLTWLWIALGLVALFAILYYSDALDRRFDRAARADPGPRVPVLAAMLANISSVPRSV